jgi:hypothetical protein
LRALRLPIPPGKQTAQRASSQRESCYQLDRLFVGVEGWGALFVRREGVEPSQPEAGDLQSLEIANSQPAQVICLEWAFVDSNHRPSLHRGDALNHLS